MAIVDRFRQRVWRICYRLLCDEQDAADAAQEVFLRLFLHRGEFAGRSKYPTWVHGVALRTCLGIRRSRGRRRRHETLAPEPQWESRQPARSEAPPGLAMDLMNMLETLDEEDRAMLLLKYAEGYDYEELAEIFELIVSACKMRRQPGPRKTATALPREQPQALPAMSIDFLDQLASAGGPAAAAGVRPQAAPAAQPRSCSPSTCWAWRQAAPLGVGCFFRGLLGAVIFSVTGRFAGPRRKKRDSA